MKTLSAKMVENSIGYRWENANRIDTAEIWQSVMDNISGMKTIAIYMGSSNAARDTLYDLWDLAFNRHMTCWDRDYPL